MTKLVKKEGILIKIESTPGVDAVPVAASDSMMVENVGWSFAGARMADRNAIKSTLGKLKPVYGGTLMQVTFDAEVKGSGTAGTAPEIGVALRACGCDETIVAVTSVTYSGISTAMEYATIYFYEDGSLYKLTGAQGTFDVNWKTGEPGKVSFTFTGHLTGPIDAALPTFVFDATVPEPFINASFATGGFGSIIDNLQFSAGNEVVMPPNPNAADGYGQILIVDKDYAGSFDPEATLIADDDPIGDWIGGVSKAITTGAIGASAGNINAMTIPTAFYKEIGPGDRDGIRTYDIGYMAEGDDSAFSWAFT